ncbi:hypothetical protein GH714_003553 [Hevea brasiliensis]|uniref:Uncharacterized protein n=1 Tax=Hevea brasiliensis TaxID=3981 RepID=A0A6A6LV17_HEVBR|nr:hypothetical protein GH714_003553 [Hevea brasiliensis]
MSDPLTALMYAVHVMNFLKTLTVRTLRYREESAIESAPYSRLEPSDENGHQSFSQLSFMEANEEATIGSPAQHSEDDSTTENGRQIFLTSIVNIPGVNQSLIDTCPCELVTQVNALTNENLDVSLTTNDLNFLGGVSPSDALLLLELEEVVLGEVDENGLGVFGGVACCLMVGDPSFSAGILN